MVPQVQRVKPGDIVFHSGRGFLSDTIRRVTKCPWSHVSLVTAVQDDDFQVLDVLDTRVVQSIRAHESDHAWHVRAPRYSQQGIHRTGWCNYIGTPWDATRGHVVRHALELHRSLPRSYPYLELAAYLPFLRRTGLGRRILQRTDRMVCSALVAAAWHSLDFRWYNGGDEEISPDWVGPGTMWRQANRDQWPLVCTKENFNGS